MMKRFRSLLLLAPLLVLAACSRAAPLSVPDDFAELEPSDTYAYRATNASGVVLAVRTEDNDMRGSLDFWTAAVDHRLRKSGYAPLDESPEKITTDGGAVGRRLRYAIVQNGRPHAYWVTLFVTAGRVVVVEAAGDEAFFDARTQKRIEAAIQSIELG